MDIPVFFSPPSSPSLLLPVRICIFLVLVDGVHAFVRPAGETNGEWKNVGTQKDAGSITRVTRSSSRRTVHAGTLSTEGSRRW